MNMAKQKKQRYDGVVYSTADDFDYREAVANTQDETLPISKQTLKVMLDRKLRKGKVVTLVQGFVGREDDLNALAKMLKQRCGVGGTAKDGEILIQGDFKQRIMEILSAEGYRVKGVGG